MKHAERRDPSIAAWTRDELALEAGPEHEAAYFDEALNAWVLSRHADAAAALRAPGLAPNGATADEPARLAMRAETQQALSSARLSEWRAQIGSQAQEFVLQLDAAQPVDLLRDYAQPLCLTLATMVTGISKQDAVTMCPHARVVSAAAAEPRDADLRREAEAAEELLQQSAAFPAGPETMRQSAFVAMSQTMPAVLGNAWFALARAPEQWGRSHENTGAMEQAVEELLRYAGLVRTISRMAISDMTLCGLKIRAGERVILRVVAANRDPDWFAEANQLDVTRRGAGHFSLGAGAHACVAANLIRMAAAAITEPLLRKFRAAELAQDVEWQGGSGFLSPRALWVKLTP